nr:hypothetical protein CFP56_64946 [Quercus suber]
MQEKHKEEIAEIREQNKQQIDEALAEAKLQSDAQHKIQIDEMMAGMRSMFDSMRSFPNASQLSVVHLEFSSMNGEGEFSSMWYAFVVLFACLEVDLDNFLYIRVVPLWTKSLEMGIAIGSHVYNVYYGQVEV